MSKKSKITQLINACEEFTGKQFVLKLNKKDTRLMGLSPRPTVPSSAIVMQSCGGTSLVKGYIDKVHIERKSGTIPLSETQFIGVDCQDSENIKLFYQFSDSEQKITSKTIMGNNDVFIVYWEVEYVACLTFCSYDAVREETIREVMSANDEPMKRLLRAIAWQFSRLLSTQIEEPDKTNELRESDDTSYDSDREELPNNESVFLR